MTWTKENMFEPSGCLTREAFEALLNGVLPTDADALANEHVLSCPFCSDALEGFQSLKTKRSFSENMATIDGSFDTIMAKSQHKKDKKRTIWLSVSMAASILLVVGLFFLISTPKSKLQVAENIPKKDSINAIPAEQLAKVEEKKVEKEKQSNSHPKSDQSKQVQNTIRFTPPELASEDAKDTINESVMADKLMEEPSPVAIASEAQQSTGKTGAPANNIELKKSKEEFADKVAPEKSEYKSYARALSAKKVSNNKEEAEPLTFVEQMPEYPGGQMAMNTFLKQNLQYPKLASEMGISGKVYVQFTVDEQGNIGNIKILRGLGAGCDEEAIRVIKLMPKWLPGKQNGTSVKTYFTLPIIFNLQGK
jgi:protein TonB